MKDRLTHMTIFNPHPGMLLTIGSSNSRYEFLSYKFLLDDAPDVCMVEGQEAFIYALRNPDDETQWALKVFKPSYISEHIAISTRTLFTYKKIPGFYLGHRICFTRQDHGKLLTHYPGLEYAIMMPWLTWKTWGGFIRSPAAQTEYTNVQALKLAGATARALWELERNGCAHTDVAGSNIMYAPDFSRIELLDIEGLYLPGVSTPRHVSYGSPGYQHRHLGRRGQYSPAGDRFAAAILLTEMLTWWHPKVREQVPESAMSLFSAEELQRTSDTRWQTVRDVLWTLNPDLVELFDRAWSSSDISRCPSLNSWLAIIKTTRL